MPKGEDWQETLQESRRLRAELSDLRARLRQEIEKMARQRSLICSSPLAVDRRGWVGGGVASPRQAVAPASSDA